MPGFIMPQAKCLIRKGAEKITASTWRAERDGHPRGGLQVSPVSDSSLLAHGEKCSGMRIAAGGQVGGLAFLEYL